ncbi:MAG: hypothetical protein PHT48_09410 [Dechloromonas sp.]|nr:hypothetical protein [Dechloromonas sp.]
MHLTLLVPELIWPEPGDTLTLGKLALPGIEWLLGRSTLQTLPRQPYESTLAGCFPQSSHNLATLRRHGENSTPDMAGPWLCADPVHLRFHHERIVLADAGAFDLDATEAAALVDALNAHFADIGTLHAVTPRRWYLHLAHAVDHRAAPLSAVAGRRMDSELDDKTTPLYRWLNEVQMVLHTHPVNEARQQRGLPAVNSLWLWGETQPAGEHTAPATVWSDDPLAIGLARHAGSRIHPRPSSLADVLADGAATPLVLLDQLQGPVWYEDSSGWRDAWHALDADWFQPLRGQLGKSVKKLDLIAPTFYGQLHVTASARSGWQFWKKPRRLADLAATLAQDTPS